MCPTEETAIRCDGSGVIRRQDTSFCECIMQAHCPRKATGDAPKDGKRCRLMAFGTAGEGDPSVAAAPTVTEDCHGCEKCRRDTVTLASGESVEVASAAEKQAITERDAFAVLAGWNFEGDGEHRTPWDFDRVRKACLALQYEDAAPAEPEAKP